MTLHLISQIYFEYIQHRYKEQRNILHTLRTMNANWICHILCSNCLMKHVVEGNTGGRTEVTERWGRRGKRLVNGLRGKRGYCILKEEATDSTVWRTRFTRGYRLVERQNTKLGKKWTFVATLHTQTPSCSHATCSKSVILWQGKHLT
jgi:hypothetical protein